ncbi:MAG: hypothetical protein FWE90_05425 [Defluviitaleaceae bacterium]|nr:hypothetical protein [Defluviitaleaceae bacterium]
MRIMPAMPVYIPEYSASMQPDKAEIPVEFEEIKTHQADAVECVTCSSRRYQDQSSDGGVSMQSPTHIHPDNAAAEVRNHETEHQFRDRAHAESRGREVIDGHIQLHTSQCAECGRVYVSGGTSTTVSRSRPEDTQEDEPPPMSFGEAFTAFA